MYRLNGVTAVLEGRTRHDPVLGMTGGKFTVSLPGCSVLIRYHFDYEAAQI